MPKAVFRVQLPDGSDRSAAGDTDGGPLRLLPEALSVDAILSGAGPTLAEAAGMDGPDVPAGVHVLAPIGSQEVWAAGVTYLRSREARVEEAVDATPYDLVYAAERPELFSKCAGWRVRGPEDAVAVRGDSTWDVPEPELTLVLDAQLRIVGYTIGDDVSSRSIEGANTLYLPQAKTYDGSCAIGPALVPAGEAQPPFPIRMTVQRDGGAIFAGETSTDEMARPFDELAGYLGRALTFPVGAFLMTGTGLVPDPPFTLEPGDLVRIEVPGLGVLAHAVERRG
jgi:2-dehydro-3-deoxy-D-arabinonate dehydratase